MSDIPGVKRRPLWNTSFFWEVIASISTIAYLVFDGITSSKPVSFLAAGLTLTPLSGKLYKARQEDKDKQREQSPTDLDAGLWVLHGAILALAGCEVAPDKLRITFWRVVPPKRPNAEPTLLEQITVYVGGKGGPIGRTHTIHAGCIGAAAREAQSSVMHRETESEKEFRKLLVSTYSYSPAQARDVDERRWSAMGVPIFGKDERVVGVVYLDSMEKDFFKEPIKTLVAASCEGLAKYIHIRYTEAKT